MNREETILVLQKAAEHLARERGYTDIEIGEDRQKGIWGENLTKYLEEKFGSCTQEIKWRDPENRNNHVEFRFRFADPVISINTFDRGDKKQNMASIEYSDHYADWSHYDEDRILPTWRGGDGEKTGHFVDYVHTGDFEASERLIWGDKGHAYEREIESVIAHIRDLRAFTYDELKDKITDVVNMREGVKDGTKKAEYLDNLYLEYTNELAERDNREKVTVDIYSLYEKYRESEDHTYANLPCGHITYTEHVHTDGSVSTYYDLYQNEELVCMDGETCEVVYKDDKSVILLNSDGEDEKQFKLSREEFDIACVPTRVKETEQEEERDEI